MFFFISEGPLHNETDQRVVAVHAPDRNPPTLWVIRRVDESKAPCPLAPRGRVYPPPTPSQGQGASAFNLALDPSPPLWKAQKPL